MKFLLSKRAPKRSLKTFKGTSVSVSSGSNGVTGLLVRFLVGAFLVKSARLLQWLVFVFFFRQTTELTLYVPFFAHCALLPKVLST